MYFFAVRKVITFKMQRFDTFKFTGQISSRRHPVRKTVKDYVIKFRVDLIPEVNVSKIFARINFLELTVLCHFHTEQDFENTFQLN